MRESLLITFGVTDADIGIHYPDTDASKTGDIHRREYGWSDNQTGKKSIPGK